MEMQSLSHDTLQDRLLEEPDEAPQRPQTSHSRNWPTLLRSLNESSPAMIIRLLPSLMLLFIPLAFYVLGISILRLDDKVKKPDYDPGYTVIQTTKTASTLWPIMYAMVAGSMIKAITLYNAERGARLGTLEVLTTSQTLASTLRGCFSHRIISIWTVVLAVVWSLSPAGGQAVLRSVELHKQLHKYDLRYYPSDDIPSALNGSPFSGAASSVMAANDFQRVVEAVISSPDATVLFSKGVSQAFGSAVAKLGGEAQAAQSTRMDLWGNVRIPFLHLLPNYDDNEGGKWVEVSPTDIAPYSSLIGHTIRKVPYSIGNVSLPLKTVYHTLECTRWFNGTQWLQQNPGRLLLHERTNSSILTEFKSMGYDANMFLDILDTQTPTADPFDKPTNEAEKAVLVFGVKASTGATDAQINMTHCETTASYVETEVNCVRALEGGLLSCTASRMRESPDIPPSNWGFLNWGRSSTHNLLLTIPTIMQPVYTFDPSGLHAYLMDPPTSMGSSELAAFGDFHDVPMDTLQARLALLLNTCIQGSGNTTNILGADGPDGVLFRDVPWFLAKQYGNTTGTWTEFAPSRYEVQYRWFALYFVATTVLAICAVATVVISALTRAPDLFSGVSSLTRDSAFMTTVPDGGSALSGPQQARLLQDVWVRVQDVKPEDDVGRIAFSDQKELGAAAGLWWERKYE